MNRYGTIRAIRVRRFA